MATSPFDISMRGALSARNSDVKADVIEMKIFVRGKIPEFGEDEIYNIPFNSYEASAKPEDWEDKDFLKLRNEDMDERSIPPNTSSRTSRVLANSSGSLASGER